VKATTIAFGLIAMVAVAVGWYVYRGATWKRQSFRGRYEQPVDAWRRAGVL